ncbi:hypothetical protein [Desulfobacter latus]|uniref:MotA/TolQ/ExbB proton channel domain-containing protein n=1 Tax=Desulfobacter latus TaxID=2292 RepID=A0A850T490_9BACT|nr:hypothetical protein [Desulfobacter latus]NWH06583.1 hypothetical protein [Desulfobacter latus]
MIKGMLSGVIITVLGIYLFNLSGLIIISSEKGIALVSILVWTMKNLGFSIIPFIVVLVFFLYYLHRLFVQLGHEESVEPAQVAAMQEKLDLLINLFFGIGVVWTAIGMRNALVLSIGSIDAETAASQGAFSILTRLVDGGILLSLSTTIAGGIGGYFMKVLKAWFLGPRLNACFEHQYKKEAREIHARLDHIARIMEQNTEKKQGDKITNETAKESA